MFSPLRNRFGIPGVISVIALVFAMMGGAYAATNTGGKATASAKAKKGPRGPKGPAGPAGAVGPAGPAGPAGAKGDTGPKGDKGDKGDTGPKGEKGEKGPKGDKGAQGEPWTAGGTLPGGKTETGAWAFGDLTADSAVGLTGFYRVPISFNIQLADELEEAHVHYVNVAGKEIEDLTGTESAATSTVCTGNAAKPTAAAGHLCIYEGALEHGVVAPSSIQKLDANAEGGASTTGVAVGVFKTTAGARGWGAWAVTAEEE